MLKASVIGNLGSEPEMKYSASGAPFLRFNVASNYRTRSAEGQWEDKTEWVRVTVFGQRAESLSQYLKKGMRVFVDGRLEARPWTDQQGGVRAGLELIASDVEFMSARNEDGQQQARPAQRGAADDADLDAIPF
jgi:single-strand DNA-binding protein